MHDLPSETPFAIIDMGSSEIRLSIVSALQRHLPVVYEEHCSVPLVAGQDRIHGIPISVIEKVVTSFQRFKSLCEEARVHPDHIHVVATEAIRVAANADDLTRRIFLATDWQVRWLPPRDEALLSIAGIMGAFHRVHGLTVDLGEDTVTFSYVATTEEDNSVGPFHRFHVAKHPVSLPFSVAALSDWLRDCQTKMDGHLLFSQVVQQIDAALVKLGIPSKLRHSDGYDVYLSGSGFRAVGYLAMTAFGTDDTQQSQYPIPILGGYCLSRDQLAWVVNPFKDVPYETVASESCTLRISKHNAAIVPASCFLLSALMLVLSIRRVYFSDSSVGQGLCYQMLSPEEQSKDPLLEGARAYAARFTSVTSVVHFSPLHTVLWDAIPDFYLSESHPLNLYRLLPAAIHLCHLASHYPKESRACVAFNMPLAGGPLSNVPGMLHTERATLALILAYSQGGQVADPIFDTIHDMVGHKGATVCKFVGRLMELVFVLSPIQPGVHLSKSGIAFSSVVDAAHPEATRTNALSDIVEKQEHHFYPHVRFCIQLSPDASSQWKAPVIMALIESMNKKINGKSVKQNDEQSSPCEPPLFSIDVKM